MTAGLSPQELWSGVVALCIPAAIYLIRDVLDEWRAEDAQEPWRWGGAHRRAPAPATWGAHIVIGPAILFISGFTINMLLRFG